MEVAAGIHRLAVPLGDRVACTALVVSRGEALVFDTAIAGAFEEVVFPYLDELGVTASMLRHVVISHADFDHFGANAELRAWAPDASFLCHAEDRRQIEDVEALIVERYGEFAGANGMPSDPELDAFVRGVTHACQIDGTLEGGDVIDVGDLRLEVMHVPGHSHGHLALFEASSRCALIADAVLGAACPTEAGAPAFPPTYRYVDDYLETIERLETVEADTLVTGHFSVMRGAEIRAFYDTSREFVARTDQALADALHTGPRTTRQLVDELGPVLGDWPTAGGELGVFPMVGHLERLEAAGRVERSAMPDGLTLWQSRTTL
jgi:glyoxylase-like metal-dependent hydrolase (beta-lactamase superfamily II)